MMLCYIVWSLLLFVVLATTADDYFAPSLTTLSRWLGLRERIAGLTFLALGNGAADMFSVIAAVEVGATDLAVGALQGGEGVHLPGYPDTCCTLKFFCSIS